MIIPQSSMSEPSILKDAPIVTVARALAERRIFGFVWFDEEFVVSGTFGRLVDFVEIGEPLVSSIPALIGLEQEILSLAEGESIVSVPAVSIVTREAQTPRLDVQVLWLGDLEQYLCIASRTTIGSEMELELSREIRRRLMAEAETAAALRELELASRDLEDFAGIISHDLQSPMRAMRHELAALDSILATGDMEAARAQTEALDARLRRMSDMMTALLDYASRRNIDEVLDSIDTGRLVRDVIASLSVPDGFSVMLKGDWPVMETYRSPLDGVLRNLIENAIKHHNRAAGTVCVSARMSRPFLEITVDDDGIGIPEESRDAVFLPFRTLAKEHLPESASGVGGSTGMGLAYVKRTVEAVGGNISISECKENGCGTRVLLKWPLKPEALGAGRAFTTAD